MHLTYNISFLKKGIEAEKQRRAPRIRDDLGALPGALDPLIKELVYIASHTAAPRPKGLSDAQYASERRGQSVNKS